MSSIKNDGGSIAVIAAIIILPIILAGGVAVDYSRASSARAQMQSSLDAGLLAAAHSLKQTNSVVDVRAQVEQEVRTRLQHSGLMTQFAAPVNFQIDVTQEGIHASISSAVPTTFMAVASITTMDIEVAAATENRTEPVEVAMVLDTTGSMAPNMQQLRVAAREMVDIVTSRGMNRTAKVAIVPYVGAVNIGNSYDRQQWLDVRGDSPLNAINLRRLPLAVRPTCNESIPFDGAAESINRGTNRLGGWLEHVPFGAIKTGFNEVLGIKAANAYDYAYNPCFVYNPVSINNWQLFADVRVPWKGCVEARPVPYDVDDTPPNMGDPRTLWVPYFWADSADAHSGLPEGDNNYLPDGPFEAGTRMDESRFGRAYNIKKYDGRRANVAERGPTTTGPNKACPDPLVPLTDSYSQLTNNVSSLTHYNDSGTNIAEGVAWGMRVLSPDAPFSEGAAYGSVPKVMVLFTDGANHIRPEMNATSYAEGDGAFMSHYSSYGTLRFGQFPKLDYTDPVNDKTPFEFMNSRTRAACTNVKNAGIELYVVVLGITDETTISLMQDCATSPRHIAILKEGVELPEAFKAIARRYSPIRLTR